MKVKEEVHDALGFAWRDSDQNEISYYVMLTYLFAKNHSPCIAN